MYSPLHCQGIYLYQGQSVTMSSGGYLTVAELFIHVFSFLDICENKPEAYAIL